jgi:drug/metabolite transporter (DMT)-like permease
MAGAVAVIVAGAIISAWGSLDDPLGIALALGSAVVFAISLLVTQQALKHAGVVDVALVSALSAAAVALLVGIIVEGPGAFVLTPQEIGELALAALGAQLVPLLGRSWALSQISANMVGAEGVLAPVATAVLSFLFIDAVVTGSQVLGLVVITAGALIATLAGSRNRGAAAAGGPD